MHLPFFEWGITIMCLALCPDGMLIVHPLIMLTPTLFVLYPTQQWCQAHNDLATSITGHMELPGRSTITICPSCLLSSHCQYAPATFFLAHYPNPQACYPTVSHLVRCGPYLADHTMYIAAHNADTLPHAAQWHRVFFWYITWACR